MDVLNWIRGTCREIFQSTIALNRPRLEKKFYELKRLCHRGDRKEHTIPRANDPMTSEDRTLNVKRVNNISSRPLDATAEELLSRGPKFSITPSVNSSLLRDVERNFEGFP